MLIERSLMAQKFRSLAKSFERFAETGLRPTARGVNVADLSRYTDVWDEAGALVVTAFRRGYLPKLAGLAELIAWFDNPPPQTGQCQIVPCPGNLFEEFCGNNQFRVVAEKGGGLTIPPGAKAFGGILPSAFPDILPGVEHCKLEAGYPEWQAKQDYRAFVCNWLAEAVLDTSSAANTMDRSGETLPAGTINSERDAWLYEQCCKRTPYSSIRRELDKHKGWEPIGTVQGVKQAANRHATAMGKPPIPSRQPGRPPKHKARRKPA